MKTLAAWSLVFLAFGGYIAGIPAITSALPVNPIAIGAAGTLLAVIIILLGTSINLARLWPVYVLWLCFLIGTLGASPASVYAEEKPWILFSLTILSVVGGAFILSDQGSLKRWRRAILAYGTIIGLLQLIAPSQDSFEAGRLVAEGSNTIAAARAAGAAAVVLLVLAVATKGSKRFWYLASALPFIGLGLASASRGPILAIAFSVLFVVLLSRSRKLGLFPVFALVGAYAVYEYISFLGFFTERLTMVHGDSRQVRWALYRIASEVALANPFGVGWGQLSVFFNASGEVARGVYDYPHNVPLEVLAEAGWLAGVLFLVVIVIAGRRVLVFRSNVEYQVLFGLLIFYLVNALVSGDVNSNRGLWVVVGGALATGIREASSRGESRAVGSGIEDNTGRSIDPREGNSL